MNATETLTKYLKYGYTDINNRFLAYFSDYVVAEKIVSRFNEQTFRCEPNAVQQETSYRIEPAGKGLPVEHPVFRFLEANPHPALVAACLFGSMADRTACAYSDFDGLLVIDASLLLNAVSLMRLRNIIARTEKLMLETDPLQHHGWHLALISPDSTILDIDLPLELLEECKSIIPAEPVLLRVCNSLQSPSSLHSYRNIIASLKRKLSDKKTASCLYTFKNMCSEFMLVPALLLQAMGHPVSKKDSFKLIERHIAGDKLSALRTASEWRRTWRKPELTKQVKRFHTLRKAGIKLTYLLPSLPDHIRRTYPEWKAKAEIFLNTCDEVLEHSAHHS